jgi:hypothetical protein
LWTPARCLPHTSRWLNKGIKTVPVFDDTHHWFSASTFDKIPSAYGLTLTDPSKVPATYAKVVKKDGKEVIVFDDTTSSYSASSMNRILSAYSRTDAAK